MTKLALLAALMPALTTFPPHAHADGATPSCAETTAKAWFQLAFSFGGVSLACDDPMTVEHVWLCSYEGTSVQLVMTPRGDFVNQTNAWWRADSQPTWMLLGNFRCNCDQGCTEL